MILKVNKSYVFSLNFIFNTIILHFSTIDFRINFVENKQFFFELENTELQN